jgi:hypothetical protein
MGLVVTGISQTSDIAALESALVAAGFSLEPVQLIEPGDDAPSLSRGIIAAPSAGGLETGTGVPGLTSGTTTSAGRAFFRDESLAERLGDFEIPDDEIDNYLEALAAGRSVVGYFAKDDSIDRVEEIFRASGLAKVKRF